MRLLALFIYLLPYVASAQETTAPKPLRYFTAGLHYASIYAHTNSVQNTAGANPIGLELLFTKQRRDENNWQQCHCYFNSGAGIHYFNYDKAILGEALALFYFFEPQFKMTTKLKLLVSANMGLSFLSNPYHESTNPTNMSYSLPVSAYISLGTGLQYPINKHWQIGLLAQYLHISNAGLKEPNRGINWPSINMRFSYNPIDNALPQYQKRQTKLVHKRRIDLGVNVSTKTMGLGDTERFFIFGSFANYSQQVSSLNAITGGVEMLIDNATKERLRRANIDKNSTRAGILIGHEFLFGNFTFSQQVGYYLINETNYFNDLYQRWGVTYYTKKGIGMGANLLTHAHVANFLDLRLLYHISK